MQIQIQFINADVEDKGKYKMAEITYKDISKGQTSSKKLMSFTNPLVYKTMVDAKKGEVYNIELIKNDKGYWDWTSASIANGVDTSSKGSPETSKAPTGFPSPKSTYETPEERAKRQVLIVRQSSLSNAIDYLNATGAIKKASANDVTICAQEFYDWVFEQDSKIIPLADLPTTEEGDDDIPY